MRICGIGALEGQNGVKGEASVEVIGLGERNDAGAVLVEEVGGEVEVRVQ